MHQTTVRIRDDQYEWIEANDDVNLSGVVREALDRRMPDE